MIAYFDTSALVKLVLEETGSVEARELWLGGTSATSRLSYPEGRSALVLARRARRLTQRYASAVADFDALWPEVIVVELDPNVARRAGQLAEKHALRGADAVQLAAALSLGTDLVLASWDRALAQAGRVEGLPVVPTIT